MHMSHIINTTVYFATAASAMVLSKHEPIVAAIHAALFLVVAVRSNMAKNMVAVMCGIILFVASFLCVSMFNMWKHNNTAWSVPVWMPFTWMLVAYFVMDTLEIVEAKLIDRYN